MKEILLFIGALLFAAAAAPAALTSLIDFGDSLSDVGNDYTVTGGTIPGKPGYYNGRFSNGPVWLEKLGPALGLGTPTASTAGGNDYGYGGVTSGTGYTSFVLPNIRTQINTWTSSHTATSSQLFTVLGGANDLFANLDGSPSTTTATQAADNISGGVAALYSAGARNILVGNLPDLGKTPKYRGTTIQAPATAMTVTFDTELSSDLNALVSTSPGLNLYRLDLFTLFNNATMNPGSYGLSNVTMSAYTGDTVFIGNGTSVSDPSGYLFWDQIHPTATGHNLIAQAAIAAVPEPASLAVLVIIPLITRRYRLFR